MRLILLALAALALLVFPAAALADGPVSLYPDGDAQEWALTWHKKAKSQRAKAAKYAKALRIAKPKPVPQIHEYTSADASGTATVDYFAFGLASRERATYLRDWLIPRYHKRVYHPGGGRYGAARWMPLARYVGWPESALPMLRKVIWRESNGDPNQVTPPYGAAGLLQFLPQWHRGVWWTHTFNPHDPAQNLKHGLLLWQRQGRSFLPAWALTAY